MTSKVNRSTGITRKGFLAGEFCMVGEFGCNNGTSYGTAFAWMEHCLKLWKNKNIG